MAKYIDAHTHHLPTIVDKSTYHCINSVSESDWDGLINTAKSRTDVMPFLGIHPWHVTTVTPGWADRLRSKVLALKESRSVGLGECGLDRSRDSIDLQREVFKSHLEIAKEICVPLSVHCVRAWSDLLELFTSVNMKRTPILLHSYSGNKEITSQLQRWNVFFSLTLNTLSDDARRDRRRNSTLEGLNAALTYLPKDRILVESDNEKGKKTEHQEIQCAYREFAAVMNMSGNEAQHLLQDNFNRYSTLAGDN